jgi:hypothetical protein
MTSSSSVTACFVSALIAGAVFVSVFVGVPLPNISLGFTNAELKAMEGSIKKEFEKREGVKVTQVYMIRESSTKATGFVKLEVPLFSEIAKSCSATMEQGGNHYVWQCE